MKIANKIKPVVPLILILPLIIGVFSNLVNITSGLSGLLTVGLTLGLMIVGYWSQPKINHLSHLQVNYLMGLGLLVIFIIQLWVLTQLPTTVYNDPFRVLSKAEALSRGHFDWGSYTYFWRYPNNVNMAYVLSRWLVLTNALHLTTNWAVHLLTILILDMFMWFSLKTVQKLSRRAFAPVALLLFYLCSPFAYTYYLQVFYSDSFTLLALMVTFWILINWRTWPRLTRSGAGMMLLIIILLAQVLKPTLILLVIAMALVTFIWGLSNKATLKTVIIPFAVITLGIGLAIPAGKLMTQQAQFTPNERYQMPVSNWIYMSYNPNSYGMYNAKDIKQMNAFSTMKARQAYLQTALPQRLHQLGPWGIVRQWFTKMVILLNGGQVSSRYNQGYINAPKAYQRLERGLTLLGNSLLQAGFALIYLIGIRRCWQLVKSTQPLNIIVGTAVILALGYISFHTLIWESECRYGQVILPLLLVIESWPLPAETVSPTKITPLRATIGVIGIGILGNIGANLDGLTWSHKVQAVAIQRSQLSAQYGARNRLLAGKTIATQRVDFNRDVNYFRVEIVTKTKLKYKLVNLDTQQSYSLQRQRIVAQYSGKLAAGHYQIQALNTTTTPQPISMTFTDNYKMAPYPVQLNGHWYQHGSFIYRGVNIYSS